MGPLRSIALVVLLISFLTFVAFFGRLPGLRNTPIGFLHRAIWIYIPNTLRHVDLLVTGGRFSRSALRLFNYLLYDKHPVVLIFFLGLISASAALIVPRTWSKISSIHHVVIPVILPLPYLFTYLATSARFSPYITRDNHARHMSYYPYDRILYHPGHMCRTCLFLKPARSKHCSMCKTCVARNDHHCIWVNNCLGRNNYRWFLLLLLSTSMLLAYGAYLAYIVLTPLVEEQKRVWPEAHYRSPILPAGLSFYAARIHAIQDAFFHFTDTLITAVAVGGVRIAAVGLLAFMTAPLPAALLGYHIYLIWAGMTTNESAKWSDWRQDMYDGRVFLGKQLPWTDITTMGSRAWKTRDSMLDPPTEPPTDWPVRPSQILVQTRDGKPPHDPLPESLVGVVDPASWKRCWRLTEVENIYDLGFWDNLVEVLR
ncbi:zf-DHHC-domain-containing protein [Patellaria atrata CBS 101060]|uniref:Palmitoyltransferase n=1 Tax=Patellaria atrata CBS 101060 TaxID=1346257 RepID=A0A9P4S7Q8_9PEZI|nr:zf-DHHC-domain-containing protein [Patellaria atrata CBS 101060]